MLTWIERPAEIEVLLERDTCLELLQACTAGTLACTARALPVVVPVTVRVVGSSIRLGLGDALDPSRFDGHVVALGAGVAPTPRSDGWWVLVRGEARCAPGRAPVLQLEAVEVEGRRLPATGLAW